MGGQAYRNGDLWATLIEFVLSTKSWWIALCAEFDLTPVQGQALRSLDPDRPVPMSTLADALVCDASNVTGIVDKLESRGLIARQATDQDRRVKQLVVTDRGRRIRDKLIARMLEPPPVLSNVPTELKARLTDVLRRVMAERQR